MEPSASESPKSNFTVRFLRPEDRETVRRICADTGFLGSPIDPVFEDRELFADYLTGYYTDQEPESTLVCELDGEIVGYLMGSRRLRRHAWYQFWNNGVLFAKGIWRYFTRPYNAATRKYVAWLLTRAGSENPHTPKELPHFHINLLPKARKLIRTRMLVDRFLAYLVEKGEKGVYGQMVTFEGRRGEGMFERFGFRVVDKAEVTKYRDVYSGKIFLFTIIKDLTEGSHLYGNDLRDKDKATTAP